MVRSVEHSLRNCVDSLGSPCIGVEGWGMSGAGQTMRLRRREEDSSSEGSDASTAPPAVPAGYSTMKSSELGLSLAVTLGLGGVAGVGAVAAGWGLLTGRGWAAAAGLWSVGIAAFHFGEFVCVAAYRPRELKAVRFLLPGLGAAKEYNMAFFAGIAEFIIEAVFFPSLKSNMYIALPAGLLMIACAVGRIASMAHCAGNFSHIIEVEHRDRHQLVTTGPYAYLRHPAYFFWFWWSVSSQVCLGNPLCTVAYTAASYFFFRHRIPYEEQLLASEEFFGDRYKQYRAQVPTWIPFIP